MCLLIISDTYVSLSLNYLLVNCYNDDVYWFVCMAQIEAAQQYSQYVNDLVGEAPPATTSNSDYQDLLVTDNSGIRTITFNRPTKYNAFSIQMYKDFTHILNTTSSDNTVKAALITGAGKYYSSGNDLSNFTKALSSGATPQQMAAESSILLRYP